MNNNLQFYNIAYSPIENNINIIQRVYYKKKKLIINGVRIIKNK